MFIPDKHCQSHITDAEEVPLTKEVHEYIDSLNFGIFEAIPPLRIIDGHANTRWREDDSFVDQFAGQGACGESGGIVP